MLRDGREVTGSPDPLKAKEVLITAASNERGVRGKQIRFEGIRIPDSNIHQ